MLVGVVAVCCAAFGEPVSIATEDGLKLTWSEDGDVAAIAVGDQELPRSAHRGGFFLSELAQELSPNLIGNGSLEEDADADGIPDGFTAGTEWRRDPKVARTGESSMKCAVEGAEDKIAGSLVCSVPVRGGTPYLALMYLKSHARRGHYAQSGGYVQELDESGERTTEQFQQFFSGSVTGTTDWTRLTYCFVTQPDTRRIAIRTDIYRGHGTIWADDFSLHELGGAYTPVTGTVAEEEGKLRFVGELAEEQLELEASAEAEGEKLVIEGELRDTSGQDRLITLTYRLPVAAAGGRWWDDISTAEPVAANQRYLNARAWGRCGPFSVYPCATVHAPEAPAALALGIPMDRPRPFRLLYGEAEGLAIEYDFALTAQTEKAPSRASFRFVAYRHDPEWGFRAATGKYYDLFPQFFEKRVERQGNWYYLDLGELPQPEDFGLAFNEQSGAGALASDEKLGMLSFRYTEPWGYWHRWGAADEKTRPTYEEAMAKLHAEAQAPPDRGGGHIGSPLREQAESILRSGCYDAEGKQRLDGWHQWGKQRDWFLYFTCSPDPDLAAEGEPCRAGQTWEYEVERAFALGEENETPLDGIYLDSIAHWTRVESYRREHFAAADLPLTFARLERRPTQLQLFCHIEFTADLKAKLDERGALLMANIFPCNYVFFNHLLDVMGHEVWGDQSRELLNLERTLAYQKPYCLLMQLKPDVPAEKREAWMQSALFFGIFPNIVGGTTDAEQYERFRPLFKRYMPAIIELAEAGWEPITHARSEAPDVGIERFGPRDGNVYFTVKNFAEAATEGVALRLLLGEMGIEGTVRATEMISGQEAALEQEEEGVWVARRTLRPQEVRAFRLTWDADEGEAAQ